MSRQLGVSQKSNARTKVKLLGAQHILEDVSLLQNVGGIISEAREILNDGGSSRTKQKLAIKKFDMATNSIDVLKENNRTKASPVGPVYCGRQAFEAPQVDRSFDGRRYAEESQIRH